MDILTLNKQMPCPESKAKIVAHIIGTGVNPVGPLAGRVEIVKYADVPGDTSRTLGGGKMYDYSDQYGENGHETGVAYHVSKDIPAENLRIRSYNSFIVANPVNPCLAAVLEYVKAHPEERHIVNMSLTVPGEETDSYIQEMHELIKELVVLNVAVVVAAGNDGQKILNKWPTCFYEPITVAALNNDGSKAHFSTWHDEVDFAEIGVSIPTLTKDGGMVPMSGTSFAAPILCNKLAKIWLGNPSLTEPELYEQAKANCLDFGAGGRDPYFGWGWIASVESKPIVEEPEQPKPVDGKLTAAQLVAYFQNAVAGRWGYVWSLNGELYTREMAEKYHAEKRSTNANRDPATYWLTDCAKWIGKMAADCSGGIVGAIRTADPSYTDRSANTFFEQCTETGPISTIPEIPGLCVWRDGHIGIYEGNGYVLEFRGTDYGAVRTKLAERTFTNWGKLRDIQYETEGNTMKVITKNLNYDVDVQALQTALNALGYDCGVADGKAGDKTLAGIAAFCAAHSAATVMPDTITLAVEVNGKKYALNMAAQN